MAGGMDTLTRMKTGGMGDMPPRPGAADEGVEPEPDALSDDPGVLMDEIEARMSKLRTLYGSKA